jgi:3-oxoacyl-[acyl-carrier-protein] synthase II
MGIISPVGNDIATAWDNILKGVSGIGPVTHFDATAYATRIAGQVRGFDPAQWIAPKEIKKMDPFIHYGIAAGTQALRDAGLEVTEQNAPRSSCMKRDLVGCRRSSCPARSSTWSRAICRSCTV